MKYYLLAMVLLLVACTSNDDVFDKNPAQRNSESIANLKRELVEAPYGWRVLYFPKTDSLLFSNPSGGDMAMEATITQCSLRMITRL